MSVERGKRWRGSVRRTKREVGGGGGEERLEGKYANRIPWRRKKSSVFRVRDGRLRHKGRERKSSEMR